jgi:hypothetical protein
MHRHTPQGLDKLVERELTKLGVVLPPTEQRKPMEMKRKIKKIRTKNL